MAGSFSDLVQRFADVRVAVVGDLMLDRYITGTVRRISPEAPVPVVEIERTYERPGGAANVAANVRALGATTSIVGLVGADPDGERLRAVLAEADLAIDTVAVSPDRATTVKTRVVAHGQQIVRIDREATGCDHATDEAIFEQFSRAGAVDVVILSDYAKGTLGLATCSRVIARCRERGLPVIVDPKGRDYRRYTGATAITPNRAEAAQALGVDTLGAWSLGPGCNRRSAKPDDPCLVHARNVFFDDLGLEAALVTQGELGMLLLLPSEPPIAFPATARDVADVTGAGDTVAAVFALCVATGASFADAAFVANAAAGVVVGKAGAAAISADELIDVLQPRVLTRGRRTR